MTKFQYSIFHILYSRASRKPSGYALLLSILVLSTMLTIGLTVTTVITAQVRLTRQVFNAMKALAAADSGIERGLYEDFNGTFPPGGIPPDASPPFYSVTKTGGMADASLVGAWAFDKDSGTTAADSSGNGNTGTLTNGPTWISGKYNNALSFDGADDYVTVGTPPILAFERTNPFTLSAWVKRNSIGTTMRFLGKQSNTGSYNRGYQLAFSPSNVLSFNLMSSSNPALLARVDTTDTFTSTADWYHIAVTYDGSSSASGISIYVDGVMRNVTIVNDNLGTNTIVDNNVPFQIGARDGTANPFNGLIDEVRIYNRALSQTEIQTDMNIAVTAVSGTTTLKSIGTQGKAQRSVEVNY